MEKDTYDKYKMFKNFLHNELHVTKEDIRSWIQEAIKEEVTKVVSNTYSYNSVQDLLRQAIFRNDDFWINDKRLRDDIKQEVAKQILETLNIKIDIGK